ncbi:glycogen debranching protein GlgX [Candidatus Venteria ishoeyi]|uniref:Glycogen debranching enzyme n=1 Tax=Candidatus Venteria ishoeyi TaxID=1899563 RepID=A0A1H6F5J5_9GAMM|nr:glycogen debranching protein GlgX [Candidatus Venteria ishoeyi]MDM8545447.1 glycogen debranching protein GlgX [Candidatus Venteria ishoeyi]SEH04661.1 Glycogen debranching enzyme [Candidatus Venteria ishoeyi]
MPVYASKTGKRYPLGAVADSNGVNFCIFSRNAEAVELLLYEKAESPTAFQIVCLDPQANRSFFFWHVYVEKLPPGIHYTWRVNGLYEPRAGHRYDSSKELLDPWARAVTDCLWKREEHTECFESYPGMRAIVLPPDTYDWEGDEPLKSPHEDSIIYELHVGGFTRHKSSKVKYPGTFSGIIEKIPYLKSLGITHVELLPIMAFDEQDVPPGAARLGLHNYWGYSTHSFFSPHPTYCKHPKKGKHQQEFRDMVKALHQAGIGVILDVVFNHTAEGGNGGPTINFKGLDNAIFYHLDALDQSIYRDYTGCGNTINCNHPLVTQFIIDSLKYWVQEMHVDGFRFDLASVLVRDENGEPMHNAPATWAIEFSRELAGTYLIAEAWDAAGLYQVGAFPGYRWMEWNGLYRDVLRRFLRGERGLIGELAMRLTGSNDLYQVDGRLPVNSINFITCHDGFTLHDLVSYEYKNNEGNGENNNDGCNHNLSWNCGIEGKTSDQNILTLRNRQIRNAFTLLLLSHGVPMLLAGDEVQRTQKGNNNAYCQDNELSWFDWHQTKKHPGLLHFVQEMTAFRKRHKNLMRRHYLTGQPCPGSGRLDVRWHGYQLNQPLWDDPDAQLLVYTLAAPDEDEEDLHIMINMSDRPIRLSLPRIKNQRWHRAIDTSMESPQDIISKSEQHTWPGLHYQVSAHSIVVMESRV